MRQVPQYLLIGDGRVGRYFFHYFNSLNFNVGQWSRRNDPKLLHLADSIEASTHVLVLISDRNIETSIQANSALKNKIVIHCSGNLVNNLDSALTGSLVRKDKTTIEANLNSLANDNFRHIYQAFVRVYSEDK